MHLDPQLPEGVPVLPSAMTPFDGSRDFISQVYLDCPYASTRNTKPYNDFETAFDTIDRAIQACSGDWGTAHNSRLEYFFIDRIEGRISVL